jgi:hypothetical protein
MSTAPQPGSAPITQEKKGFRHNWPEWIRQLPMRKFPPPKPDFQLIDQQQLNEVLNSVKADPEAGKRIEDDMKFLDHELLRLFRERDYEAKYQQNRYRMYQISYMLLATAATMIGSLLAVTLRGAPQWAPWFGFAETVIALAATFLAALSGRESPLPRWIDNRRRAEQLRREYFRFLMDLPPYDNLTGFERRKSLSLRAAQINRGTPADSNTTG